MKKFRVLGAVAALAYATTLAACGSDDAEGSDSGTITIGWIGQMSGSQAIFGEQSSNAIELALEDLKEAGAPDIEVIFEDNEVDPAKSVTIFQSMMAKDPVAVISGGSSVVLALAPLAEQNGLVLANTAAQSPELVSDKYPAVYNFIPTGKAEAEALAERIYEDEGIEKVAMEFVDADYGIDTSEAFANKFEDLGGEIVASERHELEATDMRTQLRKIKDSGAEAMVVVASEGEVGHVAAQADEIGIGMPVFGFTYALSPTNYNLAGTTMTGWRGIRVNFDPTSESGKPFADRYREAYGEEPIIYAAIAYQTMMILGDCLTDVGNDRDGLKECVADVENYEGVMGNTTMGDDREVEIPLQFWEIVAPGDTVQDWS